MSSIRRISFAATLLAGSALAAAPSVAQNQGFHPVHPVAHPHPVTHPAIHPVPPGTYRMIRPGGSFHRAPGVVMRVHPFHAIIAGHVPFARFTPAQRALWVRGHWYHRWWNGRYGWWWNTGGVWFWYGAPVYPYPTVVSDYYYEEPVYSEAGPTWWYCYNPPGYYPYIPSCYTQWTPVPAQGYGPGYGDEENGPEQGPPSGYDQGPPPGNQQGTPPGYDQGPSPGDQGPPPNVNPPNSH